MRQRGFFTLPIMGWAAVAAGVVILGLGIAVKVQTARLDAVKAEYATFKAEVKVLGDAAIAAAKVREAEDKQRKEKADAQNAKSRRDLDGLYAAYRSLRDQRRSGSGEMSTTATFTPSADRTCFDSKALAESIRGYETGVLGVIEQGDSAIADLNSAKKWAQMR